jgi:hypothetical protein
MKLERSILGEYFFEDVCEYRPLIIHSNLKRIFVDVFGSQFYRRCDDIHLSLPLHAPQYNMCHNTSKKCIHAVILSMASIPASQRLKAPQPMQTPSLPYPLTCSCA